MTLEQAYYWSQITLTGIAAAAAVGAFSQLNSYKLFEVIKFIDSDEFREARSVLYRDIGPQKDSDWWDDDPDFRLRNAAFLVCSRFQVLCLLIEFDRMGLFWKHGYRRFFIDNWGGTIVRTRDILDHFLQYRRNSYPMAYLGYDRLAKMARKRPHMPYVPDTNADTR